MGGFISGGCPAAPLSLISNNKSAEHNPKSCGQQAANARVSQAADTGTMLLLSPACQGIQKGGQFIVVMNVDDSSVHR